MTTTTRAAQMPELLPCPFCSSKAVVEQHIFKIDCPDEEMEITYSVSCRKIGCVRRFGRHYKIVDLIEAWNKRAA